MASQTARLLDEALSAFLSAQRSEDVRAAEERIEELASQAGFASALVAYLEPRPPPEVPRGVRRLAAVLLRRSVVERRWASATDAAGALPEPEKADVRRRLPPLLADPDGSVRALTAEALGKIGGIDFPRAWPDFVTGLRALVEAPTRAPSAQVHQWLSADGALLCLDVVLNAASTGDMPAVTESLAPTLLAVCGLAGCGAFEADMRSRAFGCVYRILEALAVALDERALRKPAKAAVGAMAGPLLAALSAALSSPGWHPAACRLKKSALNCITQLIMFFPKTPHVKAVLPSLCTHLVGLAAVVARRYVLVDVNGGEEEAPPQTGTLDAFADTSSDVGSSLEPLLVGFANIVQAMNLSSVPAVSKAMLSQMPQACGVLIMCAQLTEAQLDQGASADVYDEDELEDGSMRTTVCDTLRSTFECSDGLRDTALSAIAAVCAAAFGAAAGEPVPQDPRVVAAREFITPLLSDSRWKVAEAAIYAMGSIADVWLDDADAEPLRAGAGALRALMSPEALAGRLISLLQSGGHGLIVDAQIAERAPFLLGRALWCASRLGDHLSAPACASLIVWSVEGLLPANPLPIRFAACVSLSRLLKKSTDEVVEAQAPVILERLGALLVPSASPGDAGESPHAHFFLKLLCEAIAYAPRAVAAFEARLTPLLIGIWLRHSNDPLLRPQCESALALLLGNEDAAIAGAVVLRLLPVIGAELGRAVSESSSGHHQSGPLATLSGVAEGCADLLHSIVERSSEARAKGAAYAPLQQAIAALLRTAVQLLAVTDDASLVAAGARLITASIRAFGPALVSSGAVSADAVGGAMRHILRPNMLSDDGVNPAGPLAISALRHLLPVLPREAAQVILTCLCERLAFARLPSTLGMLAAGVAYAIVADQDAGNPVLQMLASSLVSLPPALADARVLERWACVGPLAVTDRDGARKAPALAIWARAVADVADLLPHPQPKRLLAAAAARVLSHRPSFAFLSAVRVAGEAVEPKAAPSGDGSIGSRTRAGRAKSGKRLQSTEVVLPVRLLFRVVRLFLEDASAAAADEGCDGNEEDEGDDDEDDEDDEAEENDVDDDDGDVGNDDEIAEPLSHRRGARPSPFVDASRLRDYDDEEGEGDGAKAGDASWARSTAAKSGGGIRLSDLFSGGLLSGGDDASGADDIDGVDDNERREAEDPLGLGSAESDPIAALLASREQAASASRAFLRSLAAGQAAGDAVASALLGAVVAQLEKGEREELLGRLSGP
jgi:hypothetical protein